MSGPLTICYLNGSFEALVDARISPLDRGFLFADSVYEVLPVFAGRPFRFREHFDRLARSLREIRMLNPHTHEAWLAILQDVISRNGCADCYIYLQITRGYEFGRNHAFPANVTPTVFVMASHMPTLTDQQRTEGLSAITREDIRWARCDIKTTALLPNVLLKQEATEANAQEAILIRDGEVLEGASTTVFAVLKGTLVMPPNDRRKLPGTTGDVVLELAAGLIPTSIRAITLDELRAAQEVWLAAATRDVLPVTRLDGEPIADGRPGAYWRAMADRFVALRESLRNVPAL